jgi:hypothetical protein
LRAVEASRAAARASARARILDAAVQLIGREGINDVRIARIAMQAGVSASLLHYLAGDVRTHLDEQPSAAPDRLRGMIDHCLPLPGRLHDDWMLWVELWLHAGRRPELRPTAARLYARLHAWFSQAIADGEAGGELVVADRARTVDHLLALLDGYGVRALVDDFSIARAREDIWAAIAPEPHVTE